MLCFLSFVFRCRLQNDVKPYSLAHSLPFYFILLLNLTESTHTQKEEKKEEKNH